MPSPNAFVAIIGLEFVGHEAILRVLAFRRGHLPVIQPHAGIAARTTA